MKLWEHCNNFYDSLSGLDDKQQINMRCLKVATARFLKSGTKDDAFDVYYCFSELYQIFGEGYEGSTLTLLDILADHETNAGAVIAKHRDHYSHAVYVFALGLTLYQINPKFQNTFSNFYKEKKYASHEEFLYRWGIVSLFHDVGYPFEIAFKGMQDYTKALFGKFIPQLTYDITDFIKNDEVIFTTDATAEEQKLFAGKDCHELLADAISNGSFYVKNVKERLDVYLNKGYVEGYTDHAYFSAIIVLKTLLKKRKDGALPIYIDTAVSILLHSSFWRRNLAKSLDGNEMSKGIKLTPQMHPLVFMLNFCDDLQVFDRIGYGHYSKDEPLPRTAYFDVENGGLTITYSFGDEALMFKDSEGTLDTSFISRTIKEVENKVQSVVDLSEYMPISFDVAINNIENPRLHTSASFFRYILEIAQEIHSKYVKNGNPEYSDLLLDWDSISLEAKMSNIAAAKFYANQLAEIGYFYDDRVLGFTRINHLTNNEIEGLARREHDRWCAEKLSMGWTYEEYNAKDNQIKVSKRSERKHNCLKLYDALDDHYKDKDADIAINIIKNLTVKRKGKTSFYVYGGNIAKTVPLPYYVGIAGHRYERITQFNVVKLEKELKDAFENITRKYGENVVLLNSLADGFDLMAAKVATEFGWTIKAILPMEFTADAYYVRIEDKKLFDAICAYKGYVELRVPKLFTDIYEDASKYIAFNCNVLVCAWDNQASSEPGGTYSTIELVKRLNNKSPLSKQRNIINVLESQLVQTKK
ncbi:MAG: RyR domain-containing protein [Candidatus Bathyarchaeota archaeon]|uniref:RyR domain-containing protein n=1 Tax=Candidatus Bathycorpusculum sp. TaxID=2994959 RepID=UPI0028286889|nr:RyR domain-containing protein [Candidatus Termiticorpusculum sp.]MCL2257418.1 RyR domain-containing protein [Candidatus Termiticorpusculum sp.]MCL2292476.1 RyR domain-containing protein [Candidatus Termiticorpusculum sp.]